MRWVSINYNKILICTIIHLFANFSIAENRFYNDRERGWYYHECISCEEFKDKNNTHDTSRSKSTLREMDADQVLETLASVQKEMQVRQARYTLEPSVENAHDFLNYQRILFKAAVNASDSMQSALLKYPYLDPRIEAPVSQQAIKIKNTETQEANDLKIKEFSQHFQFLYFFKAECLYCQEFQPILERVAKEYDLKVDAISSDGKKLENSLSISTRNDIALVKKLNITNYPTIIAYNRKNNIYLPISRGFLPEENLKQNIVHVYEHILKLAMEVK